MDRLSESRTPDPVAWGGAAHYAELESRVLAALRSDLTDAEFNGLALEIHGFQRQWNIPYALWCASLPLPRTWRDIPAVPQAMFKRFRLACFPPEATGRIFRTSGTTGETRGEHHLLQTRLYDASVLAGWRRLKLPPARPVIIAPRAKDVPDSSLARMLHVLAREISPDVPPTWLCKADGRLDVGLLDDLTHADWSAAPVALLGTALGFLNFFDALEGPRLLLHPGSYAMETGGFKGSGRDVPKPILYGEFEKRLGLDPRSVWNEYGMCELSSQFYTRGLQDMHRSGPWVRALVVSPETGEEVPVGEQGVLRIFDLANLGSVLAVQTADLAIRREKGFELMGRDPAAVPRGCSRAADETMRASAPGPSRSAGLLERPFRAATPPLTCSARAHAIAEACAQFSFLGPVTADALLALVTAELGHPEALDRFVPYGSHRTRALAPKTILHVLSGNTPAAALQTLMRGLLLGARNLCKLPARGLPEVSAFLEALPPSLRSEVITSLALPEDWIECADAIIVFGSDETVSQFRRMAQPWQTFIAHGHQLSLGIVFEDPGFASVAGAARDASIFDQQGCLSPHVFYVMENETLTARAYATRLAQAMAGFEAQVPRGRLTLSESNSIRSLREEISFRAANGEPLVLHQSAGNTAWTVVADETSGFPATPLNRVIFVKPLPSKTDIEFARVRAHLSTCGVWPLREEYAEYALALGVTRICPLGEMQRPPITWHHDGRPVLAPLVRWVDCEGEWAADRLQR